MPTTYTLINSNTLSSSATSITFSTIPATYTDLVLKASARTDDTNVYGAMTLEYNGGGGGLYGNILLQGDGTTASSARSSSLGNQRSLYASNGNSATGNTFSNTEWYIPSYIFANKKVVSLYAAGETNATTAYITYYSGRWEGTAAINSITIGAGGSNFLTGSSFYLYGISNA
jgi:hypothetical protein